ncbi:MAG: hypothetical protein KC583_05880 [Myxococcales bacterium]|nr:hypothetical protein [Myxococcales bacterium]
MCRYFWLFAALALGAIGCNDNEATNTVIVSASARFAPADATISLIGATEIVTFAARADVGTDGLAVRTLPPGEVLPEAPGGPWAGAVAQVGPDGVVDDSHLPAPPRISIMASANCACAQDECIFEDVPIDVQFDDATAVQTSGYLIFSAGSIVGGVYARLTLPNRSGPVLLQFDMRVKPTTSA